jgi:hypothetical protein
LNEIYLGYIEKIPDYKIEMQVFRLKSIGSLNWLFLTLLKKGKNKRRIKGATTKRSATPRPKH